MSSLRAGDYRKVLELVAGALQCSGPGFPDARVTGFLRDAFQAKFAGAGRVDLLGTASTTWGDSPAPLAPRAGFHDYAIGHPVTLAYRRTGQPHPMRASDLPPCREEPARWGCTGTCRLLAIPLAVTSREICAIALMRDGADFTSTEMDAACQLQPVLGAIYALRERLAPGGPAIHDASTGIPLTARELAVLHLMTDGLIATAIARRLGISPHTVSRHMESVYRKLDAHDRATAILRAQAQGCLQPRSQL